MSPFPSLATIIMSGAPAKVFGSNTGGFEPSHCGQVVFTFHVACLSQCQAPETPVPTPRTEARAVYGPHQKERSDVDHPCVRCQ